MRKVLLLISWAVLAGMMASAILCAAKMLSPDANRLFLLGGAALWFIATPFWMKRKDPDGARRD